MHARAQRDIKRKHLHNMPIHRLYLIYKYVHEYTIIFGFCNERKLTIFINCLLDVVRQLENAIHVWKKICMGRKKYDPSCFQKMVSRSQPFSRHYAWHRKKTGFEQDWPLMRHGINDDSLPKLMLKP